MTDDLNRCPSCSTPLTQVGKLWICQEHGQVEPRKPSGPMRIFLSYGHDANAELVERICADLKARGHDVWFDKGEIRFGDDWRREISDGIVGSNRVLSFLSKYSTRDPGVCLDELAIAIGVKGGNIQTILVESEAEVKAPPSIGHIQWLGMHDWRERRATDEAAWESWYQTRRDRPRHRKRADRILAGHGLRLFESLSHQLSEPICTCISQRIVSCAATKNEPLGAGDRKPGVHSHYAFIVRKVLRTHKI